MAERDRPHIVVRTLPASEPFTLASTGRGDEKEPFTGDRTRHGRRLTRELQDALAPVGDERAGRDTLDRNDRWYRDHMHEAHWAAQMMQYLQEDAESWLAASDAAGEPVGMVAVSTFDPGVATITFIGVVPEHRGHGYGHDLLQAATSAAHGRGFEEILSDVDTLNQPMIDILRNAGHLEGVRPWHIWHYRAEMATLVHC